MPNNCLIKIFFTISLLSFIPLASITEASELPELHVRSSPDKACSIQLDRVEKVADYDVSPAGPDVAAIVKFKDKGWCLMFWRIGDKDISRGWTAPTGFTPYAIAWHPKARGLFVIGAQGAQNHIVRLDKKKAGWVPRTIFKSPNKLRRLVVGPSRFDVVEELTKGKEKRKVGYRLFFGMQNPDGTYRIVSISEEGKGFYQVIGPAKSFTTIGTKNKWMNTSKLVTDSALPLAFHPAGHQLIWEDDENMFHCARYGYARWVKSNPLLSATIKGGSVAPTPNGLGLLHWQPSSPGMHLHMLPSKRKEKLAPEYQFVSTPSFVPDGRGIVGLTESKGRYTFNYLPITMPLANVVNAWMFCQYEEDVSHFEEYGGLFRNLGVFNQLYRLYESENYNCGGYSHSRPTRPYFVTTDIFWELFAAAYEGLFIVKEREEAIPAFWKFIETADRHCKTRTGESFWKPIYTALVDLRSGNMSNPETARIRAAKGQVLSEALGKEVDYAELKPRGHYTTSVEMQNYFKAFRYLTSVYSIDESSKTVKNTKQMAIINELKSLPPEVRSLALKWINSYQGFISPSRAPLVWKDGKVDRIPYNRHPNPIPTLFPLSWGFDNETLLSTVFHPTWPPEEQITGPDGDRMIASGLDVAAALGNGFADTLLESEYKKYPNLKRVMDNLRKNYEANAKASPKSLNLYDRWITALGLQWADDVRSPNGKADERIWRAKRLQTGLASWATLRHATVLVNERTAAECGEGGFEEIIMPTPKGYVEPDPRTFEAIAALFETAVKRLDQNMLQTSDKLNKNSKSLESLRRGIIRRLRETANKARLFKSMAEKQLRGEDLTSEEYEEILHVGRVAEHNFLVFKSLGNKDYALSTPDPIPKIVDVAGSRRWGGFRMAAVGKPLEWDHIVPYYGRRHIVKGAVYSYYEFVSQKLLNDKDWREMVKSQPRPAWIKPFMVNGNLTCPAITHY